MTALVIGYWGASFDDNEPDLRALLVDNAARFPELRALFMSALSTALRGPYTFR